MVAEGEMKEWRALQASGTPMECPPPNTSETVGVRIPEISSAIANPASTSPHRIEDDQQPFDGWILLNGHQLRDHVLIFGGFVLRGQGIMSFNLSDDGQAVEDMFSSRRGDRSALKDLAKLFGRGGQLFLRIVRLRLGQCDIRIIRGIHLFGFALWIINRLLRQIGGIFAFS